jgi:hypothetical protein
MVINNGSADAFNYGLPSVRERPSSDDISVSVSMTADDAFSFIRRDPQRRRIDGDSRASISAHPRHLVYSCVAVGTTVASPTCLSAPRPHRSVYTTAASEPIDVMIPTPASVPWCTLMRCLVLMVAALRGQGIGRTL